MMSIVQMLGKGLLKKEKHYAENKTIHDLSEGIKESKKFRKKVSMENFLRDLLGTHLIQKKF